MLLLSPNPPSAGKMTYGAVVISAAILASKQKPGDTAAAGRELASHCKTLGLQTPANPSQFVRTWRDRMDCEGNIQYDSSKSGQQWKLSAAQVERAYKAIIGWKQAGQQLPYECCEDAAENCEEVKQVLVESGAAMGTLENRIKQKHPKFGRYQLTVRWQLSADNKRKRVATCKKLLAAHREQLKRVVHLDAKTVLMYEKVMYGLVDLSVPYSVCRIKPARRNSRVIKIKYYAAVNAQLGPFFMTFGTGTTNMPSTRDGLNYTVSLLHK